MRYYDGVSLHRPKAASQLRSEDGVEEFEAQIAARDLFWRRAEAEGLQPLPTRPTSGGPPSEWPGGLKKLCATRLDPPPSARFRAHGGGPGRWPGACRKWPEWRAFLKARDRIAVGHLALCHQLTAKKLTPEERDQLADDFEEVWQMAREQYLGRAVEVYDPQYVSPKTGQTTKFSTTVDWWVLNAVKTWRKQRARAALNQGVCDAEPEEPGNGRRIVVTAPDFAPEVYLDASEEEREGLIQDLAPSYRRRRASA